MDREAVAGVLEECADLLWVHGRCRDMGRDATGAFCVLGGLAEAVEPGWHDRAPASYWGIVLGNPLAAAATEELMARVDGRNAVDPLVVVPQWNDDTEDDFTVIETIRETAKDLRAGAAA